MEVITSIENQTVKRINKLKQKKYRDETGEFFIEGYKNVLDTYRAQSDSVRLVIFGASAAKKLYGEFERCKCVVFSDALFEKITETQNSQGVMSINAMPSSTFPTGNRCILLDRVRDPGNVGTIVRTAAACGYDVVLNDCADVYSPKVVRSAMSAIVKCRIGIDIPPSELKNHGYELIVADMSGANVFGAATASKFCIVIGNEADGVSSELINAADRVLSVPMENIESLNASVAAGIMMYALRYSCGI